MLPTPMSSPPECLDSVLVIFLKDPRARADCHLVGPWAQSSGRQQLTRVGVKER